MFQYMSSSFFKPALSRPGVARIACKIHAELGYGPQDKIAFMTYLNSKRSRLEIVIFHRSCSGKLEVYKIQMKHTRTPHLYLHEVIIIDKKFEGVLRLHSYVCEYCFQGFKDRSLHYCKFTCNVCDTSQCYTHPKKWKQCVDCARYCRSDICYEMHKQPQSDGVRSRCDLVKYCDNVDSIGEMDRR